MATHKSIYEASMDALKLFNLVHPYMPLIEYHKRLNMIVDKITTIQKPIQETIEFYQRISKEIEDAENNYLYRLANEEITHERDKTAKLEQRNIDLERDILEYEKVIMGVRIAQCKINNKHTKEPIMSLKPNITLSQIVKLHEALHTLFDATIDQWRNLFSENITEFTTPIVVSKYASDVRVLFYYLKEERLITVDNYPSIIEKSKAFSRNSKPLTAKQLHKPTEYSCYPDVGSYVVIAEAVRAL